MKPIKADLSKDLEAIEIHPLADLHIGDMSCDFKAILDELEYIKNTPNCYCVLDGDLMDTAIASSIGDTYGASHTPMEQLKECVNLFAPIKDKILAVEGGNHENRIYKTDGVDITELMCHQLGIADRYSPTTALIFVRFGNDAKHNRKMCYTVYMTHGSGGGRKEGGKINRLADLATIVDADIYLMAHTHSPAAFRNCFYRADPRNNNITKTEHLFVNTAAWLRYSGYGDKQGYKPASNINPVIYLDGRTKGGESLNMMIYVSHEYGGNAQNVEKAKKITHDLQVADPDNCYICPLTAFSHLQYGEMGYDAEMELCLDILSCCDKLIVASIPSEGVRREIEFAKMVNMEVEYL